MIRWYADNSDLRGIWDAAIPDILFFGGIAVDEKNRSDLCSIIQRIKSAYRAEADFPFKWNFRDLENYYQRYGLNELYQTLLAESQNWRAEIFRQIAEIDFTIIISILKCHGKDRGVLLDTHETVSRFVFSNALMRFGLFIKDLSPDRAEIILDWPPEGQRGIFDDEYRSAFQRGTTADDLMGYYCGPLRTRGFADAALYSSTRECPLLQLIDMIVGATREMVEEALGKREGSLGLSLIRIVRDKFRGAPKEIIGRGISLAPTRGAFYETLKVKIVDLLLT